MRQIIKNNKSTAYFSVAILLALSAILAFVFSQKFTWPVGVSHDSVFYLNGARSLMSGKGYAITHFPPLYPASLALVAVITGKDVISSATLLVILLYGLNLFLAGFLMWRLKNSLFSSLSLILVLAVLPGLERLYFEAMSEPLFFTLLLVSFIFLVEYLIDGSLKWAVLAGFVAGLSALTRYIGIFLIAAAALSVLVFTKSAIIKKLTRGFISGVSGALPLSAWWISNLVSKGMMTNRLFVFHPKDSAFFLFGWQCFSDLLGAQYFTKWTLRLPGFIFIICLYMIFTLISYFIVSNLIKGKTGPLSKDFAIVCLLSLVLYFLTLLASMTFFDDSTTLAARIISPIYFQLIIWIWVLFWPSAQLQKSNFDRMLLSLIVLLLIFVNLPGYISVSKAFKKDGILFTGRAWSTSKTMAWVNQLPDSIVIYSNENIPLGFFTKHPVYSLPESKSVLSGIPNQSFEEDNSNMLTDIRNGKAVLIIFTKNDYSEIYQSKETLIEGLEKCSNFEDSEVYTGQACFREYCGN